MNKRTNTCAKGLDKAPQKKTKMVSKAALVQKRQISDQTPDYVLASSFGALRDFACAGSSEGARGKGKPILGLEVES